MPSLPGLPTVLIGHHTRPERPTGATVILTPNGAVAAVDVRGAAPGTRETDLLDPANTVTEVHAVVLAGGSAYGLAAATGVMDWLRDHGHGMQVGPALVPIVPAAVLFDLFVGDWRIHPDRETGFAAAEAAISATEVEPEMGNVGAGAGATVGKLLDPMAAMKSGIGHAVIRRGDLTVAAIVACNAVGDVRDPATGRLLAGARADGNSRELVGTTATLVAGGQVGLALAPDDPGPDPDAASGAAPGGNGSSPGRPAPGGPAPGGPAPSGTATTIGAVLTNATLTKAQARRVATCAHDGIARAVDPAHTTMDGDTMFALATGELEGPADLVSLCAMAAEATAAAILAGTRAARGLRAGPLWLPAAGDLAGAQPDDPGR